MHNYQNDLTYFDDVIGYWIVAASVARHNKTRTAYNQRTPRLQLLKRAQFRSKKYNLPCTITVDDIGLPTHCPILGTPLKPGEGRGGHLDSSPSLDRIDPKLGYVPGNVAVISARANRFKNDATLEELEKVVEWLKGVT